ncbi:hypothetical protein E4U22_002168 [Claviceps purpurea]|nr:hypothetical protein E4U12_006875 [Claviceps purpurea]KAG6157176.1 hypothetical protein E4U11_005354 [Claviceps purpurea]KAG6160053.1 hypothetical protein E4U37_001622 [Claviceps purpurea]KAG6190693.1 hypothetical protein E4U36_002044 [Claviceps purpurea]KAG6248482.1 hypothetical protein E4U24_002675 [Claviceps purpurea]
MDTRSVMRPSRPQSVKELVDQAENFNFNTNIPFKHWTRAAETLYQEAAFALSDGDYGRAYMMLYRHSVLVLDRLRHHPQYKAPESRLAVQELSKRMNSVLTDLEEIKPIIRRQFEEWERTAPTELKTSNSNRANSPSSYGDFAAQDPSLSGNATVLDASEHQELAVELAQKELARRDTARQAHRHAKIGGAAISSLRLENGQETDIDLQSLMKAARIATETSQHEYLKSDKYGTVSEAPGAHLVSKSYKYPSIAKSQSVRFDQFAPDDLSAQSSLSPPQRPPKEHNHDHQAHSTGAPPELPKKIPNLELDATRYPAYLDGHTQPPVPLKRSLEPPAVPKKERLAFKPGAYLENGDPIRSIFLPKKLRATFMDIASQNTKRGLEMCGILCGTPVNNALFVRCLLIPDQKCTSDTCETENESAIFDFCAGEDLMVLGWIHTHPTQTCFMSSRDLHTHAGYQVMMPESIAIVCSPKFTPSYGIFRLTHPPGLDHILDCRKSETFHQHDIDNLYREAEHPDGHVYENDRMSFDVKDLRTK